MQRRSYKVPIGITPIQHETESIEDRLKDIVSKRIKRTPTKDSSIQVRYNPSVHPKIIEYMRRDGASNSEIAKVIGIGVGGLVRWGNVYSKVNLALNTSQLAVCEEVTRALYHSAIGQTVSDTERVYEYRINPVSRIKEKVLIREKENSKTILPNPLACFFYLQNRDVTRWSPAGAKDKSSGFTPEQISVMLRTSATAMQDATLGIEVPQATRSER